MQEMKISLLESENYELSNKSNDNDPKNVLLDQNLKRFEVERRQFELEKLKFLEEKRELDRLRLQRFERYKRELEAKRLGIRPNYDIDNPNEYMLARKVVIDYRMNDELLKQGQGQAQDSGSESEPEITIVENIQKNQTEDPETMAIENSENPQINLDEAKEHLTTKQEDDNAIKKSSDGLDELINQSQQNGKELLNGLEKSNDQKAAIATDVDDGAKMDTVKMETIEFDEKNPMKLFPFIRLLLRECRQIWWQHKQLHLVEWQNLKNDFKKCISEWLLFMMFCGMGGVMFRYTEGNYELLNKTGVKRVKRNFIDELWLSSHNLRYLMYLNPKRNSMLHILAPSHNHSIIFPLLFFAEHRHILYALTYTYNT